MLLTYLNRLFFSAVLVKATLAVVPPEHKLDSNIAPSVFTYLDENNSKLFPEVLLSHKSVNSASDIAKHLHTDTEKAKSKESKRILVEYIVYSLNSKDSAVWQHALSFLTYTHLDYFSAYSKKVLSGADIEALRKDSSFFKVNIAKVYGAAQIEYDWLRDNVSTVDDDFLITKKSYPLGWTSLTALAKNGDLESIQRIVDYVNGLPEEWYLKEPSLISHELRYIAQPEVVDLLVELLNSDKIHTFHLSPNRSMNIPAASYAAETLSKIIADFPYPPKAGVSPWSIEEIQNIREWINYHAGKLEIIDYRSDLRLSGRVKEFEEGSKSREIGE